MATILEKPAAALSDAVNGTSSKGDSKFASMRYLPGVQHTFQPPLIANENAFLGDVASSQSLSPATPITSGFYRLEKGTPLVYTYTYDEMKIILDGHFMITDKGSGETVKATKGDVFFFPKGSEITFETSDFGHAFYVGQRKEGAA
ncbi:hypothetical protein MRB53_039048 [Persea americana]|nr:hypothetical protein MRB53_039048 [Persea americana]